MEEGRTHEARKASNGYWVLIYMALLAKLYREGRPCDRAGVDSGRASSLCSSRIGAGRGR
jgi:hypothetical protein